MLNPGLLATVQDGGRPGWRRFGIPPGGAMDRGAWRLANHLLGNPEEAPVVECLAGLRLRALCDLHLAMAGAWGARAWPVQAGEIVEFLPSLDGVWHTLALPGGVAAEPFLGSASVCARALIGAPLAKGDRIRCQSGDLAPLPLGVKARRPTQELMPDYGDTPLRVWPGPQWALFSEQAKALFFGQDWHVSSRSDRTGYRLEGPALSPPKTDMVSEPVRVGSIQVPPSGQPVVTLYDGPTVGGYAKIALLDAADLDRLVQTRPGQAVRFRIIKT